MISTKKEFVYCMILFIVCLGSGIPSKSLSSDADITLNIWDPIDFFDIPRRIDLINSTPEEQAIKLAKLLQSPKDRLAAWLSVYDALGIPVIKQDGWPVGSTGDDPVGPKFWQVWYASQLDFPKRGIRLKDAMKILDSRPFFAIPEIKFVLDEIFLSEIRSAALSNDMQVRFLGRFIRERILHNVSGVDILNDATSPEKIVIDLPTLQLIAWVALRNTLIKSTLEKVNFFQSNSLFNFQFIHDAHAQEFTLSKQAAHTPCSEILGDKDLTYWTDWLLKRAARGVQLPGMVNAFPGLIERLMKSVESSKETISNTKLGFAWWNTTFSALTLGMRLSALEIDTIQEPDPLFRTKSSNHGQEGKIFFALISRPKPYPNSDDLTADGNNIDNCFISFLLSSWGVTFKQPPAGRIVGAELEFTGGKGFPDLVLFGNYKDLLGKDTDANGEVMISVIGAAQKRQIPENAKQVDKEFSIIVKGQPDAISGNTIANIFFSGLVFTVRPNVAGGITAIIDILKTFHWSLGEYVYRLVDWQGTRKKIAFYNASLPDPDISQIISGYTCGEPVSDDWKIIQTFISKHRTSTDPPWDMDCVLEGSKMAKFYEQIKRTGAEKGGGGWYCMYQPGFDSQPGHIIIHQFTSYKPPIKSIVPLVEEGECDQ